MDDPPALSYAQNLEDYHLARILGGQPTGFYIDVGAGHPVADNVSFWFYLRGWRGLIVEPQADLLELYAHLRPRDIAVCSLVGRRVGEADFHAVAGLHGFSTMVESHADEARRAGAVVRTLRLPVTTLQALCEAKGVGRIDFLKIDVEGAEGDVLAGADWNRWRPRIVLAEAVAPGTLSEAWHDWEPVLTGAGYRFAFFDGLNRFYVAEEEADLLSRIPEERSPWTIVRHLYEFGRAPDNPDHPDHALAGALIAGFLKSLPVLDREILRSILLRSLDRVPPDAAPTPQAVWEASRLLLGTMVDPPRIADAVTSPPATMGELYRDMMASDAFRAALGRIAAVYDGGLMLEDEGDRNAPAS